MNGWFKKAWRKVRGKSSKQAVGILGTGDGDVCRNGLMLRFSV